MVEGMGGWKDGWKIIERGRWMREGTRTREKEQREQRAEGWEGDRKKMEFIDRFRLIDSSKIIR